MLVCQEFIRKVATTMIFIMIVMWHLKIWWHFIPNFFSYPKKKIMKLNLEEKKVIVFGIQI